MRAGYTIETTCLTRAGRFSFVLGGGGTRAGAGCCLREFRASGSYYVKEGSHSLKEKPSRYGCLFASSKRSELPHETYLLPQWRFPASSKAALADPTSAQDEVHALLALAAPAVHFAGALQFPLYQVKQLARLPQIAASIEDRRTIQVIFHHAYSIFGKTNSCNWGELHICHDPFIDMDD